MSLHILAVIHHYSLVVQVYFLWKHFSVIFIDFLNVFCPLAEDIKAWIGHSAIFYVFTNIKHLYFFYILSYKTFIFYHTKWRDL